MLLHTKVSYIRDFTVYCFFFWVYLFWNHNAIINFMTLIGYIMANVWGGGVVHSFEQLELYLISSNEELINWIEYTTLCPTKLSEKCLGAAGYKTGLVSRRVLHLLSKLQNWICPKTGHYKTSIESNTKIDCVYINLNLNIYIYIHLCYIYINKYINHIYIYTINLSIWFYVGFVLTRFGTNPVL